MSLTSLTQKRIKGELKNLKKARMDNIQVIQDENDMFTFYFLLKGIKKSDYEGGYYMGKIILPNDYPNSPVDYKMLTPSGRFMINSSICLTNSKYHKEQWTPSWNLENMTVGFISIFNDDSEHGISHIRDTSENRKLLAKDSINYNMKHYGTIFKCFDQFVHSDGTIKTDEELDNENNQFVADKKKKKDTSENSSKTITVKLEDDTNYDGTVGSLDDILGINKNVKKCETSVEKEMPVKNTDINKNDIVKSKLDVIKNMTFENFDLVVYNDVYTLLTTPLSEL